MRRATVFLAKYRLSTWPHFIKRRLWQISRLSAQTSSCKWMTVSPCADKESVSVWQKRGERHSRGLRGDGTRWRKNESATTKSRPFCILSASNQLMSTCWCVSQSATDAVNSELVANGRAGVKAKTETNGCNAIADNSAARICLLVASTIDDEVAVRPTVVGGGGLFIVASARGR